MKIFFLGFLVFANFMFVLTNLWKALFTINPNSMVYLGLMLALFHLVYFLPGLIKEYRKGRIVAE